MLSHAELLKSVEPPTFFKIHNLPAGKKNREKVLSEVQLWLQLLAEICPTAVSSIFTANTYR